VGGERIRKQVVRDLDRCSEELGTFLEVPDRLALDLGLAPSRLPQSHVVRLVDEYERACCSLPGRQLVSVIAFAPAQSNGCMTMKSWTMSV
jgi:hypothetical protein